MKTVLHTSVHVPRFEMLEEAFGKFFVAQDEIDLSDDKEVFGDRMEIDDKYFSLVTKS